MNKKIKPENPRVVQNILEYIPGQKSNRGPGIPAIKPHIRHTQ